MAAIPAHVQASADLLQARENTSVDVTRLRTFIYG